MIEIDKGQENIDTILNSSDERKAEIILELLNRDHELLDIIKMVDKKQDEQIKLLNEQTSILNEKLNSLKNMNEAVNERIDILQEKLGI
jgi:DNA repair exonuclease SbcCD ATPase subunit